MTSPSVGKDVQWWEHSFATGGCINWNAQFGKLCSIICKVEDR